jgi:hypothetical protein
MRLAPSLTKKLLQSASRQDRVEVDLYIAREEDQLKTRKTRMTSTRLEEQKQDQLTMHARFVIFLL